MGDRGSLRIPRWLAEKMEDGRSVASSGGGRSPKPLSNAPGRGVMFRVRDKQNPKGPDFKGGLNVDGREFELAMWEWTSKGGTPYLSLSISRRRFARRSWSVHCGRRRYPVRESIMILQTIRAKLGLGPDVPDSRVLTQALGDLNARINKDRADAAAIEASIPGAVIASIDGAATERRKLQALDSERSALVKAADATRREIAAADAADRFVELQSKWDATAALGNVYLQAARDADLAKVTVADRLEVVKAAQLAFEQSQPERVRSVSRIANDHSSCL